MSKVAYYEFDLLGNMSNNEYETAAEAEHAADLAWEDGVTDDCSPQNGEVWEDTAIIYGLDEEDEVVTQYDYEVEYEHYHGDMAEHGLTMRDVL